MYIGEGVLLPMGACGAAGELLTCYKEAGVLLWCRHVPCRQYLKGDGVGGENQVDEGGRYTPGFGLALAMPGR